MNKFVGLCICISSMQCLHDCICSQAWPAAFLECTAPGPAHQASSQTWQTAFDFFFFNFFQQRIFSPVESSAAQITDSSVNDCYECMDKHWESTFVRFGKMFPVKWALFHQHFLLQEGMLIDASVSPLAHGLTFLSAVCFLQGCLLSNGVVFQWFFSSTRTCILIFWFVGIFGGSQNTQALFTSKQNCISRYLSTFLNFLLT